MKYIILIALIAWLGWAVYDLVRTCIAKKKMKKLLEKAKEEKTNVDAIDVIEVEDNTQEK